MPSRLSTGLGLIAAVLVGCGLLSGCGAASSAAAANPYGLIDPGVITAATSTDQPPFATADADGKPQGFIIDITDEVAHRLGVTVVYKSTTVPAALSGLTSGQYDLAASGLGVTAERQKSVAFTKALYWSETAVLTTESTTTKNLTGFAGKKVGVVTGAVQEAFVTGKMPGSLATKFQSQNTGVSQLLAGNIDAFVVGGPDAEAYLKEYPTLKIAVSAPVDHPTAMAIPKDRTALGAAVNQQLSGMVADGTYLKIYRKWFTEAPAPQLVQVWPTLGSAGAPTTASVIATSGS